MLHKLLGELSWVMRISIIDTLLDEKQCFSEKSKNSGNDFDLFLIKYQFGDKAFSFLVIRKYILAQKLIFYSNP